MSKVSSVIQIAQKELGYLEKKSNSQLDSKTANAGSGNYTKYWRDLNPGFQGQPWCQAFINWIFTQAYGEAEAKKLLCSSSSWNFYTPDTASMFKASGKWVTSPKIGDIIYFKNAQRIHHVGFVYKVDRTNVHTIEGNTNSGSSVVANGGGVFAKKYLLTNANIAGYGRPDYGDKEEDLKEVSITCGREGLTITGASTLNVRDYPATGKVVSSYKNGEHVQCTAKVLGPDSVYWFKTPKGYICGKYLSGWIKEICQRWWFVKEGYKYETNKVDLIDGKYYAFDKDGWMIESKNINSDGSIKF